MDPHDETSGPSPSWAAPPPTGPALPPIDELPVYAPAAPPPPARRTPMATVATAVVAAVALVAGSVFALVSFARADGAESPEAAVQQLFDAIDREDAIGVLSALPETERAILTQPLIDVVGELQRLGVLSQFPLDDVPGADLTVSGLTMRSTPVGDRDDLTAVAVTGGSITGKVIPESVPIGATLRRIITEDLGEEIDIKAEEDTEDLAEADLTLVTVQDGEGWHVSIAYSIAEAIRNGRGPSPVKGGIAAIGAETPEGALSSLAGAAMDLDLERVIGMVDPEELRALYEYAPRFLPEADDDTDELRRKGWAATVHQLDTEVSGEGRTRQVKVTGFDVELGADGERIRVRWDGSCFHTEETRRQHRFTAIAPPIGEGYPSELPAWIPPSSEGELRTSTSTTCPGKDTPEDGHSTGFGRATANLALPPGFAPDSTVTVVEVDGRWFVSPTRTLLDNAVDSLRRLTPEQLDQWGKRLAEEAKRNRDRYAPVAPGAPSGTMPAYPGGTVPSYPGTIPPYPGDETPRTIPSRIPTTRADGVAPTTTTSRPRSDDPGQRVRWAGRDHPDRGRPGLLSAQRGLPSGKTAERTRPLGP